MKLIFFSMLRRAQRIDYHSQCVRRGKYQTDSQNEKHFYSSGSH